MNIMMPKDYPKVLFQNRKPDRITTLDEYRQSGGYSALAHVLKEESHAVVKQQILDAVLLGRGGAAFPAGKKMETVADDEPFPRYIVCNADEMEPGTFKDRVLIHADPHMLIEGMIITAYGILADKGLIFIRHEYESAAKILERELRVAGEAGYLGQNILGSEYSLDIMIFDHTTCMVAVTLNLIDFFARESCGWCTPCREGLPYIRDLLARIEAGEGEEAFFPAIEEMSRHLGNAYCAFAPGAAAPVESLLTYFGDEVREHITQKKCPVK